MKAEREARLAAEEEEERLINLLRAEQEEQRAQQEAAAAAARREALRADMAAANAAQLQLKVLASGRSHDVFISQAVSLLPQLGCIHHAYVSCAIFKWLCIGLQAASTSCGPRFMHALRSAQLTGRLRPRFRMPHNRKGPFMHTPRSALWGSVKEAIRPQRGSSTFRCDGAAGSEGGAAAGRGGG